MRNSICGNSAIAAVVPVIGADGTDEITEADPVRTRHNARFAAAPGNIGVLDGQGV